MAAAMENVIWLNTRLSENKLIFLFLHTYSSLLYFCMLNVSGVNELLNANVNICY